MRPTIHTLLSLPSTSSFPPRDFALPSPSSPANPNNKSPTAFDISMGLTILVLLTGLLFMCCMSVYMRRCEDEVRSSQRRTSTVTKSVPRGLDPDVVNKLPLFLYDGGTKEGGDCAVCLGEFVEGESVRVIPCCGHVFHQDCIDTWFASHDSCPLCRATQLFHPSQRCNSCGCSRLGYNIEEVVLEFDESNGDDNFDVV
ncbi:hypothetical protein GIB67_005767 [Kingdonia uniflora]|uniref:RING-type E3 ubiquitin transferase n=1 Tax=Kingdonia uniflora TaxID=39325 RepID=A0A7J7KVI4_9MAGN|nr:hypothetical protein GIB67_005767 [Kingdonia uniflora]